MTRKPQGGIYAYVTGRGRCWIESFNGLKESALVRFDPGEGMRSKVAKVPLAAIDWNRLDPRTGRGEGWPA